MGMGTAGAVLDAISRMRRAEREMARARAGHVRPPRSRKGGVPDRLPFPCFFMCGECGWLEEGTTGDPMRRTSDDETQPGACPACDAKVWVDLRRQSTALAYREAESLDSRQYDERSHHRSVWIGAATSLVVSGGLALWEPALMGLVSVMMLVIMGTWVAVALGMRAITRRVRPGRARPRRWRYPLPGPRASTHPAVRGVVQGDPLLQAPLSQAPCLGWSVQVWSDGALLLDEQHHAAFVVGGEAFAGDSVQLELASRELRPREGDEALARFLQRRGLASHEPGLRVCEACLVPGAAVAVGPRHSKKGGLVLTPSTLALAA